MSSPWVAIANSAAWADFWSSKEIAARREALQKALTRENDHHTIGRLQGQLQMLEELEAMAGVMAKREEAQYDVDKRVEAEKAVAQRRVGLRSILRGGRI